ncbi:MAG: hypothetical protein IT442_10695 [Phycisphaeraceae bacterium]|nr:hypothetical protein [Phycisphaeraceae bacterium]
MPNTASVWCSTRSLFGASSCIALSSSSPPVPILTWSRKKRPAAHSDKKNRRERARRGSTFFQARQHKPAPHPVKPPGLHGHPHRKALPCAHVSNRDQPAQP